MEQARYQVDGPDLTVEVRSGFAKPGFYEVFLWDADGQTNEKIGEGRFSSPTPIDLSATAGMDRRILQCIAGVELLGDPDFSVTMTVSQAGEALGANTVEGPSDDVDAEPVVPLRLFVRLVRG